MHLRYVYFTKKAKPLWTKDGIRYLFSEQSLFQAVNSWKSKLFTQEILKEIQNVLGQS